MSSPFNIQEIYRTRDDTTAAEAGTPNWVTTEDQAAALSWNTATTFRIRFVLANTGAGNANSPFTLRVNKNSTSYVLITTTSADVQSADAGSDADATALTTANFELTAGTGSAVNGEYDETGTINTNTGSGGYTEFEWGLTIVDADVSDGDTLDFQVYYNGAQFDQVDITPRISVVKAAAVPMDSWYIPFADPVPPSNLATSKQLAFATDPVPIPTPPPVAVQSSSASHTIITRTWRLSQTRFAPVFVPTADVPADSWYLPFSEPVREKPDLHAARQQFEAIDPFLLTQAEATTIDRYLLSWSEPVRILPALEASAQQFLAIDTDPEVSDPGKWWGPFSEPVRIPPDLHASRHPFEAIDPFILTQEEAVTVDRWLLNLSEPVRSRPGLHASRQQFFATDLEPAAEAVTVDGWFINFSDPVRVKPDLHASRQAFFAIDPFLLTQAEAVTIDRTLLSWSEPVRSKPGLHASRQQFFAIDPAALLLAEFVPIDRWHIALSEPVRALPALPTPDQAFLVEEPFPEPQAEIGWYAALSDPVRLRPDLHASRQLAFTIDPFLLTQAETVTIDRWLLNLSEPVRFKSPFAGLQSFFTTDLTPIAAAEPPAQPPQGAAPSPMLRVINHVSGY